MYKHIAVFIAVTLMVLAGCKKEDDPGPGPSTETRGSITVSVGWPSGSGNASRVTATLTPGGATQSSSSLSASMNFSGLEPGSYSVSVEATSTNGNVTHRGSSSASVQAGNTTTSTVAMQVVVNPPAPPSNVSASKNSEHVVLVTWNSVPGATSYEIYRSTSASGLYSYTGSASVPSYTDTDPVKARWYYYKIKSVNTAGKSALSVHASGYKKGWRFDNVTGYDPPNGIGFRYDLYAYGQGTYIRIIGVYAVYYRNGVYHFVPGNGVQYAAYFEDIGPTSDETRFSRYIYINDNRWHPAYRNNNYPQFIKMRVYRNYPVYAPGDPYFDETGYYSISWQSPSGRPVIGRKLTAEESIEIDRKLQG